MSRAAPARDLPGELRRTIGVDLAATAVAAVVSGGPSTAHSLLTRRPVLATVHAAASLVRPQPGGAGVVGGSRGRFRVGDLLAGGAVHGAVSLFWGFVLARILPPGRRAAWGAAAGVAIHVIDLGVVARLVPRLAPMRRLAQLPQLADHVAFGVTVGLLLDRWDPPAPASPEPPHDPRRGQATSSRPAG